MMRRCFGYSGVIVVVALTLVSGCAKVIRPDEENARKAIMDADRDLEGVKGTGAEKEMPSLIDEAGDYLSDARKEFLMERFNRAQELATKASEEVGKAKNLPKMAKEAVEEGDRKLDLARESGIEKFFPTEFKNAAKTLVDAKERFKRKIYEDAKGLADMANQEMKTAIEKVESVNSALTAARNALVEAKEAGADTTATDLYKQVEDLIKESEAAFENRDLATALGKAKAAEEKAKQAKARTLELKESGK